MANGRYLANNRQTCWRNHCNRVCQRRWLKPTQMGCKHCPRPGGWRWTAKWVPRPNLPPSGAGERLPFPAGFVPFAVLQLFFPHVPYSFLTVIVVLHRPRAAKLRTSWIKQDTRQNNNHLKIMILREHLPEPTLPVPSICKAFRHADCIRGKYGLSLLRNPQSVIAHDGHRLFP